MRLMHLGRTRLPRHRPQRRQARERCLLDLFEAYAFVSSTPASAGIPSRIEQIVPTDLRRHADRVVDLLTLTDELLSP